MAESPTSMAIPLFAPLRSEAGFTGQSTDLQYLEDGPFLSILVSTTCVRAGCSRNVCSASCHGAEVAKIGQN